MGAECCSSREASPRRSHSRPALLLLHHHLALAWQRRMMEADARAGRSQAHHLPILLRTPTVGLRRTGLVHRALSS
jgi:hypothetical protein